MKSKFFRAALWLSLQFSIVGAFAQTETKAFFGPGLGLAYGGLGIRGELQPQKNIGLFIGAGYNLVAPAFNTGLSFKLATGGKVQPLLVAMYGYNAALIVENTFSKDYYGFAAGAGCDFYTANGKGKWLVEILVPFRKQEFHDAYQSWQDLGYEFKPGILPVTFTIGYNFQVSGKVH